MSEGTFSHVAAHMKCFMISYLFQYGLSSIPETWKQKTLRYPEILTLAQELVTLSLNQ